jgi:hypothetical protein
MVRPGRDEVRNTHDCSRFSLQYGNGCPAGHPLNRPANAETPTVEAGGQLKNDSSTPLADVSTIQSVTPSDMFSWPGIDAQLTWQSERTGRENNWYSLTGRVVAVKAEAKVS